PYWLSPQHLTPPAVVKAQVWRSPVLIALTPLLKPLTSTGTLLSTVLLLPSCPAWLLPQHLTPPAVVRAHVWLPPALMALMPLLKPLTSTGTLLPTVLPLPSWPEGLYPQHLTPPAAVKAHMWL